MELFRISKDSFQELDGAGGLFYPGRWHEKGNRVIYTSGHRSLAVCETLVHLSKTILLNNDFVLITIYIPDDAMILSIPDSLLQPGWGSYEFSKELQQFGTQFLKNKKGLLLKVPSAIIKQEYNYLINPAHPQFVQCKVANTERFLFDNRLK